MKMTATKVTAMMIFQPFHTVTIHQKNDQMQMQVQSTSEETVGEEPDFTHVHSGEMSSEMRTGANIADTPDETQLKKTL